MPLETNFDATPYFDDYDANNNFHRVLFRPGTAVQARELTQLQTILQDQIDKFGSQIFKDGSIVDGCGVSLEPNYNYIKITDTTVAGSTISVSDFVGNRVVSSSNLQAVIVNSIQGLESNSPNLNTLYIKYINSANYANGSQQKIFDADEPISVVSPENVTISSIAIANSSYSPVGSGYAVSITEGTIFKNGFFVRINPQTVVVSKYSTNAGNSSVGFVMSESIVTADADPTLFDNALGSTNYNAPGANRLKLAGVLTVRESVSNTSNFFSIINFNSGQPSIQLKDPRYGKLAAEMARRTYEESGNYIVSPFELSVVSNTTNSNNLVLEVSKGLGYVQGYRVEYSDKVRTDIRKGTDTVYFPNQIITANYGNYTYVKELAGPFDTNNLDEVGLYAVASTKLTSANYTVGGSAPATQIGTAKIRALDHFSGTPGTPDCQYKMYLFDIKITTSGFSFEDVRSIYATNSAGVAAYADTVTSSGVAVLRETASPDLIFNLGSNAVRNINTTATSFFYKTNTTRTFQANGTATLTPPTSHPGGTDVIALTGSLSEANELRFLVIANTSARATNSTGVVSITSTSNVITGSGTSFTTEYAVGDWVYIGDVSTFNTGRITTISNNVSMSVANAFTLSLASNNISRFFPAGVPVSFSREDSANVSVASDGSSAIFNLGTNLASTFVASIYYDVFRTGAVQAAKTINKNRYVKIQTNTHPTATSGPWCLGIADVTKIRGVYQGTTYSNTNPNRSDFFVLDSGQRGGLYDYAYLSLKPGSGHTVGLNAVLLIELDHLIPNYSGGIGYFSVASYPIDDANTANTTAITTPEIPVFISDTGNAYDLRDTIDFRPYANNTANSATVIANATTNPSANVVLNIDPDGAYAPSPDTNFNTAFTYYLGRKVKIALSQDGNINVVEGAPSPSPISPRDQDGTMTLGTVTIPPYPSLSQTDVRTYNRYDYGVSIDLQQHRRYTMRDIGVIDKKVARLEYYTSLSLLETSAKTLSIKDDAGLDRFKNGFVVDSFKGFSVSDTANPEYKAAIDVKMQELSPTIKRTYVDINFDANNSVNVVKEGSLITLASNTVPYIEQSFASKTRNCVENVLYVWTGNLLLNPEGDAQPDIDVGPDIVGNIDLSGLTNFINGLPNLIGPERVISTTTTGTNVRTSASITGNRITTTRTTDVVATTTETTQSQQLDFSATNLNTAFDFGEIVQDVSIQPFIRPRRIFFSGFNLKPSTTLFAYFDGIAVSQHCTPTNSSGVPTGNKGSSLISDSTGVVYGYFDIPTQTFKTGDRVFRLCDTDDINNASSSITTQSSSTYTASNISITKARYGLNTRVPQITSTLVPGANVSSRVVSSRVLSSSSTSTSVTIPPPGVDPIAQTFLISESEENSGVFINKIDVYFRSKHPTLGVELQIREVDNGFPAPKILPFATRTLTPAQVNTSTDASLATSFIFDSPVFLQAGLEYCFVVIPAGSNEGYNIWVGEVGSNDITTNTPIFVNNSTGILFTSSTNRIWTPFQKEDIKFVIHRKQFTSQSGTILYKNSDTEFLTANNFAGGFIVGEKVYVSNSTLAIGSNSVTSTTNTTVSVIANGTVNAQTTFTTGKSIYISSNGNVITNIRTITSIPNTTHIVLNTAPTFADSNASIGHMYSNGALFGYLNRIAPSTNYIQLERSTANSIVGFGNVVSANASAILIGGESGARANLVSVDNVLYSTIIPQFSYCAQIGSTVSIQMKGMSNTGTMDSEWTTTTSDMETFFTDKERIVRSRSNELQFGSGSKSYQIQIPISSSSTKVSPFFDDIKSNVIAIENIIDGNTYNESSPDGGVAKAKHISKRVVLAEGQDAEDLNVYLAAYKPSNTNIFVYAKLLNGEDSQLIGLKSWTPLTQITPASSVSSRVDRSDFGEFVYGLSTKYSVNTSSNTAMSDYAVYGTFGNTNISANVITISNTTPLDIGSLVYYRGDVSNTIANGFYNILQSNTTTIKLSTAGTSTQVLITPAASSNTASIYYVPFTGFKDRYQSNIVSYYTSTGALFHSYKTFSIKIVMTSEEGSHIVPRIADMRAIALQA
jgi:hypothetical protein